MRMPFWARLGNPAIGIIDATGELKSLTTVRWYLAHVTMACMADSEGSGRSMFASFKSLWMMALS